MRKHPCLYCIRGSHVVNFVPANDLFRSSISSERHRSCLDYPLTASSQFYSSYDEFDININALVQRAQWFFVSKWQSESLDSEEVSREVARKYKDLYITYSSHILLCYCNTLKPESISYLVQFSRFIFSLEKKCRGLIATYRNESQIAQVPQKQKYKRHHTLRFTN